jgi:hypothetical protein
VSEILPSAIAGVKELFMPFKGYFQSSTEGSFMGVKIGFTDFYPHNFFYAL